MVILKYSLCKYETAVGDEIALCERPCQGEYCFEHQHKIAEIEILEKEINKIVKGRTKK